MLSLRVLHQPHRLIDERRVLLDPIQDTLELQCAVTRRNSSAGANPARQLSLQPVAVGADDGGNDIG